MKSSSHISVVWMCPACAGDINDVLVGRDSEFLDFSKGCPVGATGTHTLQNIGNMFARCSLLLSFHVYDRWGYV